MGRVSLAFRAFFGTLFHRETAQRVESALRDDVKASLPASPTERTSPPAPAIPVRPIEQPSEALVLLGILQREGRLIDFLKEDLTAVSNEQIGAAARDIHRDCQQSLQRLFDIQPIREEDEGAEVRVLNDSPAETFRLVGAVSGKGPWTGCLQHRGWRAMTVAMPKFTGSAEAAKVLAPAEIEVTK